MRQIVDELDDHLGQLIGGRGLAGEEESSRRDRQAGVLAQPIVENDDSQRVEQLPLVFVNAFDLAVEDRVRIDYNLGVPLDPVDEPRLGGALGRENRGPKHRVVGQRAQFLQPREVGDPPVADGGGDRLGERRIGEPEPAPRRHPVGLVAEPLGEGLREVADRRLTQKLGMDRRHAVGAVRSDNGEIRHPDALLLPLLDQADPRRPSVPKS